MKPHRGTLILVFGILGIVSCFPLGIAAWVMGKRDLKEMDAGSLDPSGRGNTNAGRICGMIGTLLAGIIVVIVIVGMIPSALLVYCRDVPSKTIERFEAPAPIAAVESVAVNLLEATRERPWTNSLGMPFVPVPGTKVLFCIWETRVKDYAAYAGPRRDSRWKSQGFTQGNDHPVVDVTWDNAKAFCAWLTRKEQQEGRIGFKNQYRLPTDAEWSWAVGIGDREENGTPKDKDEKLPKVYPWGNQWPPPDKTGNYDPSLKVDDFEYTAPVGSFRPNDLGILDLGGNVWEYCEDFYDGQSGPRVLRGGSWIHIISGSLLSSSRIHTPVLAPGNYGFRVVLVVGSAR